MTPPRESLLRQLKKRRLELGLKQHDMLMQAGISRQQYQRLEAKGNPRLNTLQLVAKGLNSELMLIPQEKLAAVLAALHSESDEQSRGRGRSLESSVQDDPWQGLLGEDDEHG